MILSCPACRTRFRIDAALLGRDGRKVRCAKCTHVWRVGPDGTPIPSGTFGMKSVKQAAVATVAPEQPAPPDAATGTGPEAQTGAEPAAESREPAAAASEGATEAGAAETAMPEAPATPEAAAGAAVRAVRRAKAQKGGRKFRIFLLLLCLAVIALFMAGVVTGRIGLGPLSPRSQTPSTGDVEPPRSGVPPQ